MATYSSIAYSPISGGGSRVLLAESTASSSSTVSFTSGIDSTYREYLFTFINIHPSNDNADSFGFNMSIDGGSNYNVAKTTTTFQPYHNEEDTATGLDYSADRDLAQGTGDQVLNEGANLSADNDHGLSGYLRLFNPSSTTFVKNFIAQVSNTSSADYSLCRFAAGYANTTSAVNAVIFRMSSNNIDAGTFKLYGIN